MPKVQASLTVRITIPIFDIRYPISNTCQIVSVSSHPSPKFGRFCRFSISFRHQDGEQGCQDRDADQDIVDQDRDVDGKGVVGGKHIVDHGNDVADDKDMTDHEDDHDNKDVVENDKKIADHDKLKGAVDHDMDDVDKEREETERKQRER